MTDQLDAWPMCCDQMLEQLGRLCPDHDDHPAACPDVVVIRMQQGRYGLPIHDGGCSAVVVQFCPWCGTKLLA